MNSDYQLVSIKQIAELVGQKRGVIQNWSMSIDDFPKAVFIGKKRYFKLADVMAWLESRFGSNG